MEQGSISEKKFEELLDWISDKFVILGADEFLQKFNRGTLQSGEICLTFDDALKCQFDVAVPVLKRRSIEAFFFVYSSPFLGQPDLLEIYRYFRSTEFFPSTTFIMSFLSQQGPGWRTNISMRNQHIKILIIWLYSRFILKMIVGFAI